ncbi:multidrug ABC transporter ATP-binding protein [Candidatus Bathyarchaeota archaeon]|nr:MAG: multidrug ABC transporter ATP-binding protein [Candidatus Bathyarchaeota archaeon]
MSYVVKVEGLVKDFGDVRALDGLSFHVRSGEVFGLIGPNGAGKTTALRIISTLLIPTSGFVHVLNRNVVEEAADVRKLISYLPEEAGAYKNLSGYEYLEFMAKLVVDTKEAVEEAVVAAAKITGLGARLKDKLKTYSKGMKRRVLVARVLMTKPKLAILDEPTSGLDVLHSVHVRGIIKRYVEDEDVTVLLSSHNMREVEYLCDRVALINLGKIVAEGSPNDLKKNADASNLEEVFVKVVGIV